MGARRVCAGLRWAGLVSLILTWAPEAARAVPRVGVRVFGAPSKTAAPLAEALRQAIETQGAELVSTEALRGAENQLGVSKKARERPESLLQTAKEAEATHLLVVRLTRHRSRYRARIEFFEVSSGALRSKGTLRWDKSARSAKRLAGPLVAALLRPILEPKPDPEPEPEPETEPVSEPEPTITTTTAPTIRTPEIETATVAVAAPVFAPKPARMPPPPKESAHPEHFRIVLSGGSGLWRDYQLSTAALGASGLSFGLVPSALFAAELELRWPWPEFGLWSRGWLSPLRYQVTVDGVLREQPGGISFDNSTLLRFHVELSERWSLIPGLGARLSLRQVDEHRGNFVISQFAFAPEGSVAVRFAPTQPWELTASVSGGYAVLFRETPVRSGAAGPGVLAAGDLAARWWITEAFGLAFDTRFDFLFVGLDGPATRQAPAGEQIVNARITTLGASLQLGVALRL